MSPFWWAALVAAVAYVAVVALGVRGRVRGIKVLPALLLAASVAPAQPLAVAALVLSAAGDGFLLDKERFFLHGLASFLAAHVLFVPAFTAASGAPPSPVFLVPLVCAAIGLVAYLWPRKPVLRVAVPFYALALVVMVAAAATLGPLGIAGGLSFFVSDGVLSIRVFKRDFPGADVIVMVTYYGAILTLAAALSG